LSQSEKYTAAAYLVVFLAVLVYVVIIGSKLERLQREVEQLVNRVRETRADG
jgi:CcmD family protein